MTKQKIIAITTAVLTALTPTITINAAIIPSDSDIIVSENDETSKEVTNGVIIDKNVILNNSVKLIDKIATENKSKNVMLSPTSLNFALGMIAEGAKGETKEALKEYLGTDNFAAYAKQYMKNIKKYNSDEENYGYKSKLKIADAVWVDDNLKLHDTFKKSVSNNFSAELENLDFSNADKVCKTINKWCDKNTEGLIPEIVTPDSINKDTGLCLTNSLYFESGWNGDPWTVSNKKEKFGDKEKTKYMTCDGDRYYENDKATAFGRNYANGLSFIGILPNEEGDFTLEELDIESLLKSEPEYDEVDCKMPKLNFETSATLNDMLSDLGLGNIFSNDADFSGIADKNTKVSAVLQKTKLELDENGTKAAAVTAVVMECMSYMGQDPVVKNVALTRPFAFLIFDEMNNEILFMGKVMTIK